MAESRGRPLGSEVRQNIIDVLSLMGKGYGYDIHKHYKEIYAPVTLRTIYYHLSKGLKLGLFKVETVEKVQGNYSWGTSAEKTYYSLTSKAKPKPSKEAKAYFEKN